VPLVDDFNDIVNYAHALAWSKTNSNGVMATTPDEPGIVSQLVSVDVANALTAAVQKHVGGSQVTHLRGAFLHKRPMVTFGQKTIELGDLMLVSIDHPTGTGTATLFQAKKSFTQHAGPLSGPQDLHQLALYDTFPPFVFSSPNFSPKAPSGALWDIRSAAECGYYLDVFPEHAYALPALPVNLSAPRPWAPVVGSNPANIATFGPGTNALLDKPTMYVGDANQQGCLPNPGVLCQRRLSDHMCGMLSLASGRPFTVSALGQNPALPDWDNLVNEILNQVNYVYTHTATGFPKKSGQRHRVLCFASANPALDLYINDMYTNGSDWDALLVESIAYYYMAEPDFPPWFTHPLIQKNADPVLWSALQSSGLADSRRLRAARRRRPPDEPEYPDTSTEVPERGFGVLICHKFGEQAVELRH